MANMSIEPSNCPKVHHRPHFKTRDSFTFHNLSGRLHFIVLLRFYVYFDFASLLHPYCLVIVVHISIKINVSNRNFIVLMHIWQYLSNELAMASSKRTLVATAFSKCPMTMFKRKCFIHFLSTGDRGPF